MPKDLELEEVEITLLLQQHQAGDKAALHRLLPFVYGELKWLARANLKGDNASWHPTKLTHEIVLLLFNKPLPDFNDREHFFNTISLMMRQLLIDAARNQHALKRGGEQIRLSLDEVALTATPQTELLLVHEAVHELEREYSRPAKVVALRYFVGLSVTETAQALSVTERTVRRDWEFAKSWLLKYLRPKAKRG